VKKRVGQEGGASSSGDGASAGGRAGRCGACTRKDSAVAVVSVPGIEADQILCMDPVACRVHAQKLGIYGVPDVPDAGGLR
jgi:hypothetical protein